MKNKIFLVTDSLDVHQKLKTLLETHPNLNDSVELHVFSRKAWLENLDNPFLRSKLLDRPIVLPGAGQGEPESPENVLQFPVNHHSPTHVVPMDEVEKAVILQAIEACRGNLSLVAKQLKMGRATLYRKMKMFGINPKEEKARAKKRVA